MLFRAYLVQGKRYNLDAVNRGSLLKGFKDLRWRMYRTNRTKETRKCLKRTNCNMRLHRVFSIAVWGKYHAISFLLLLSLLGCLLLESAGITIPERMEQNLETPVPQQQAMSFYKRALPETCIAFASRQGKKLFASAMANGGLKSFFPLIQQL